MAVRTVDYFYVNLPQRAGEGAALLDKLKKAGVNLLVVHAFPAGRGVQVDLVAQDSRALVRAARAAGLKLSRPKKAFVVEGRDRVGAVQSVMARLGRAKINVKATSAVRAGRGRFGAVLWVKPADVRKAARALRARAS